MSPIQNVKAHEKEKNGEVFGYLSQVQRIKCQIKWKMEDDCCGLFESSRL
jgi:hypothetical protein